MHYVYVLESLKVVGRLYIGYTTDLKARFKRHNNGEVFATKPYLPWKLIHYEAYLKSSDAKRREVYLKTAKGRTTLKTMLKDYLSN
jgi:putative endonuclease